MRYILRKVFSNTSEAYESVLENRGVRKINQYTTPRLKYPTVNQISSLNRLTHIWTVGDRYYKLAHKHYGNVKYWWVLAWYNRKPTESHVKLGEMVFIPLPLDDVLRIAGM
ncbi:hypothetical protein CL634_00885 [bacterium]|nr:hypothetical protein [bacterium]|tara:strand:- start:1540 stop:1872 length:333 start_codon:yes stop_codon:yes gene_type:complete